VAREPFHLGSLEVPPGRRLDGELPFARRPDGAPLGIPMVILHGARPGPVLCLNSGTHGDEPEGTLAILDIVAEIDPQALAGTLIGIPVLNVLAFAGKSSLDVSGVRETPVDKKNLARTFPGRADGTVTERLAYTVVSEIIPHVDAVIDFHSGGTRGTSHWITGFVGASGELGRKSLALAEMFPMETLWRVSPWSKFSACCIEQGVQVAVVETTGQGRADEEDVTVLRTGIRNVMCYLDMIPGVIEGLPENRRCIDTETYVYATEGGISRPLVRTGELVEEGQVIGTICDVYGRVNQEVVAPHSGLVTGIRTKPIVWAGEPVLLVANFIDLEDALSGATAGGQLTPP